MCEFAFVAIGLNWVGFVVEIKCCVLIFIVRCSNCIENHVLVVNKLINLVCVFSILIENLHSKYRKNFS